MITQKFFSNLGLSPDAAKNVFLIFLGSFRSTKGLHQSFPGHHQPDLNFSAHSQQGLVDDSVGAALFYFKTFHLLMRNHLYPSQKLSVKESFPYHFLPSRTCPY